MDVTVVLLYLIITLASVAAYFIKRNLSYWKNLGIPHDEPHFIMGNLKGVRTKYQMGQIVADYYHKFKGSGPFAGFHIVQRPGVLLLDKDLIKNVLIKDFSNFTDRGLYYNDKEDPLSGHLFFVDGDKWRFLRQKLTPTFTSEKAKEDSVINIRDMCARFTTDIIGSAAFGIECNSLRNPNSEFPRLGREAMEKQRHNFVIMSLIDSFPKLARKLGMRTFTEDVHQFFRKTIKDTIAYREEHNIHRNDFLDLIIELKKNESERSDKQGLNIEVLCAQVFVFYLGAFETSSTTMALAFYELAKHPEMQERLRAEVNKAFEENENADGISYETLNNMTYLNQVIYETLRKYPILAQLNRQALKDYVVPGHPKYVIKAGMPIWIPVLGIHYDPEFYPNPEEFDPERFSPEMIKQRDSTLWLPFGDGPRNCIGERFGKMQTRLGIATVLQHFRVSACSKTEKTLVIDPWPLTYSPKNKMFLKLEAL